MNVNEIVVLPYRKKLNKKEYLIKTEKIEKWDNHPDHCSISFPFKEEEAIEVILEGTMNNLLNVETDFEDYYNLGICQASKDSEKTFYLYCINISKLDYSFDSDEYSFVTDQEILENIDSQLIVAYSRLEYLRFK